VRDGPVLVVDVEVLSQLVARHTRDVGQRLGDVGDRAVEGLRLDVDLGAVTGRDHHGLGEVVATGEAVGERRAAGRVERHGLEEGQGGRVV
jgi:hypothetical protein